MKNIYCDNQTGKTKKFFISELVQSHPKGLKKIIPSTSKTGFWSLFSPFTIFVLFSLLVSPMDKQDGKHGSFLFSSSLKKLYLFCISVFMGLVFILFVLSLKKKLLGGG